LAEVAPLWEKLRDYHASLSPSFASKLRSMSFEMRQQRFISLAETGSILVEIAHEQTIDKAIGYCVSSISESFKVRSGQIESIYIEPSYRGWGIGQMLVQRALEWFKQMKTERQILYVADGNEAVFEFYRKFNFHRRSTLLEQISDSI